MKQDENKDFWWSVNLTTKQYLCSDLFLKICGLTPADFNQDDLMLMVHPNHKNKIQNSILQFHNTSSFEERFQLLTKYGYRWVFSTLDKITINEYNEKIVLGYVEFLSESDVLVSQDAETELKFNELIDRYTSISNSLMGLLDLSDLSTVIIKTLNNLLNEFNADRVYIFKYDHENQTQSCKYEAIKGSDISEKDRLQNISINATAWRSDSLINRNIPIILNSVSDIPEISKEECDIFNMKNIQSLMVVPLFAKNEVYGYFGIDIVRKKHIWTTTEIQWFRSLSNIISLCIELKGSEELAHRERERFRKLYENMPIGFIRIKLLYDSNGNPIDYICEEMNSETKRMIGTLLPDIIEQLCKNLRSSDSKYKLTKFDELIKSQKVTKGKITANDKKTFFDYILYSIEEDEFIVLIQDNTESILASRALLKSEKMLHNIYKNIPVGIEIYDKDGILLSVNDMEQKIFGFEKKEDVLGINLFENPNLPPTFLDDLKNGKTSWYNFYYDFGKIENYYSSDYQDKKHIVLKSTILYDSEQNIENYLLIVLDNTELLKANNKIREFETLFNSIAEFSEIGLAQWNPCDNRISGTDQWYENLCLERKEITQIMDAYSNAYKDDIERLQKGFQDLISGKTNSFKEEICINNGEINKWLRCNYKVTEYTPEENNIEIIGINIDITELKNIEFKLIEAKLKAEESDSLKSAFIANMSHEIRTPLNAIIGFSDLLINSSDMDERQEYISTLRQNNDLLLQLISDILDASKIESGTFDIIDELFYIDDVFDEIADLFKKKKSNSVQILFEKKETNKVILTDREHLIQILINLVSNAIKFTKEGHISIGYILKDKFIHFYVEDTGIGIAKEQQQNIFARFVKINSFIPGTGLGLPICKSLVEKIGGKIWVESELGVGSCFWFTLPYNSIETDNTSTTLFDK